MKVDKTLAASIALHVLVIGWGLVSFSARSLEAPPPESMPVDIISADQLSKITAGSKNGEKDKPKPLVEKVAEAKPVDDTSGKITEKPEVKTEAAPEPPPKPIEKPVEKKPDPPKVDPIAEALKKEEAKVPKPKPRPKPRARAAPKPPEPKRDRVFDQSKIAALLDKRDPTRHAATGESLNSTASLGASRGTAKTLSQSEMDALRARLARLWNVQAGLEHPEELIVDIHIRLRPDKRLAAPPEIVTRGASPRFRAAADAAVRAVLQAQPYDMLRPETYEVWKDIIVTFDPRQMFNG